MLVFVDIDGVLNTNAMYGYELLPRCVEQLNRITEATNGKYVLSSSWRHMIHNGSMSMAGFDVFMRSHRAYGFHLVGVTDDGPDYEGGRGALIAAWLDKHPHQDPQFRVVPSRRRYVVIDDNDLGISDHGHPFVQVNPSLGLTAEDTDLAIRLLLGTPDRLAG